MCVPCCWWSNCKEAAAAAWEPVKDESGHESRGCQASQWQSSFWTPPPPAPRGLEHAGRPAPHPALKSAGFARKHQSCRLHLVSEMLVAQEGETMAVLVCCI